MVNHDSCWLPWTCTGTTPVVFDSYQKEDGTRKSEYGKYGRLKSGGSARDSENNEGFEHIIRYNDGITADFVLASCSVPVNYDYTRLDVENHTLEMRKQGDYTEVEDNNRPSSNVGNSLALLLGWRSIRLIHL